MTLGALELIDSGVTTVVDWSSAYSDTFTMGNLRALEEVKMRFVLAQRVTSADGEKVTYLRSIFTRLEQVPLGHLQLSPVLGDKEPFRSAVQQMTELSKELDLQLHVHMHAAPAKIR